MDLMAAGSREEADYLAGFVNRPLAQAAIARQASSTTIAPVTMNSLPIPAFDPADETHLRLSAAALRFATGAEEPDLVELDAAVADLVREA